MYKLSKVFKANPYRDNSGRFSTARTTPVERHPSAPEFLRSVGQGFLYIPDNATASIKEGGKS